MKIFVTGASGYIGGSVALHLSRAGHEVIGLVRGDPQAAFLQAAGVQPLLGCLSDLALLTRTAQSCDAVINAAVADDFTVASAFCDALAGSGAVLLHTSGTSVVADRAVGEHSETVFTEDMPFEPLPERMLRVAVERHVLAAAQRGIRSIVIRPSLIYGLSPSYRPHSMQIPQLIEISRRAGIGTHVGRGLNVWSHIHIDDVVDLYARALKDAPAGSVFFAESGAASWRSMASAVGTMLGYGPETRDWPLEDALSVLGTSAITSYGSNSRVSAEKARRMLGWRPSGPSLFDEIKLGCYAH